MKQIFPKQLDLLVKVGGAVALAGVIGGIGLYAYLSHPTVLDTGYTPKQPVPYSHKLHVGNLGMDCLYCHTTVDKAAHAAIPPTETCMNCHEKVKPQSALLAPVRESYATGQAVPWVKVHKLPDYVFFNHSVHVTAGVSCASCHGRVDQMVEVKQVQPLSMAWCLECHRNPSPNIRPANLVTKLDWEPEGRTKEEIGAELVKAKGINPPVNCSGCHR
ncbi:MAG: cytochrome c family protein [Bryobacter sp.]|jgi:hypothetical protein|nr:cytochrome c family protein [Bryobacter sp.]